MSEDKKNNSELSKNLKELGSSREQGKHMSAGINTPKKSSLSYAYVFQNKVT